MSNGRRKLTQQDFADLLRDREELRRIKAEAQEGNVTQESEVSLPSFETVVTPPATKLAAIPPGIPSGGPNGGNGHSSAAPDGIVPSKTSMVQTPNGPVSNDKAVRILQQKVERTSRLLQRQAAIHAEDVSAAIQSKERNFHLQATVDSYVDALPNFNDEKWTWVDYESQHLGNLYNMAKSREGKTPWLLFGICAVILLVAYEWYQSPANQLRYQEWAASSSAAPEVVGLLLLVGAGAYYFRDVIRKKFFK